MAPLRNLLTSVTPRGRAILAASIVGGLVLVVLLWRVAGAPDYAQVAGGIDPAETGKMTAALDEKAIPYEMRNNGTALAVPEDQQAQARVALAEAGLPGEAQLGYELFDEQKLGASEMQQQVNKQRALEGEISRTLGEIQGVSQASVRLVLPEQELFSDQQTPATAAVLVSGDTAGFEPNTVRGMAQLVSSSVEGLKPEKVTISDQTGRTLWPNGQSGESAGALARATAGERYARQTEANVGAMLARTVGPDKAEVRVQADVDADQSTREQLEYADEGTPLKRSTETEQLEGGAAGTAGGAAGTAGNVAPTYAGGGGGGGDSNYQREQDSTDFGVDKTITRTKVAPGRVERQTVALMVDRSVPAGDVAALRGAVGSATGIDTERGDRITVSRMAFARAATTPPPSALSPMAIGRWAALGVLALIFLVLVVRWLRGREGEGLAPEPIWLRELEAPASLAELERIDQPTASFQAIPLQEGGVVAARNQVKDLADRDPERVAAQVREWMKDA